MSNQPERSQSMKIVGYSDRLSVQPGESIGFMVSCEAPRYRAEIVRLVHGDTNPKGPGVKEKLVESSTNKEYPGRKQTIRKGSCVIVPGTNRLDDVHSFTMQAWIQPTTPNKGIQGILTKWLSSDKVGYGLVLEEDGDLALWIGDGRGRVEKIRTGKPMRNEWYFVAGGYSREDGRVWLHQEPLRVMPIDDSEAVVEKDLPETSVGRSSAPFVMAGYVEQMSDGKPVVGGHFNGKLESPCFFGRSLKREEIELIKRGVPPTNIGGGLLAAWDLSADIPSMRVTDTSSNSLHGQTMNAPTRAVTGHNWSGRENNFRYAQNEYGAIHFHEDDLDDARWQVDFEYTVPEDLKSGIYAARLRSEDGEDYIPFYVRPKRGSSTARIAFLVPTFTYLAYSDEHMMTAANETMKKLNFLGPDYKYPVQAQDRYIVEQGLNSLYDLHTDGSGVGYASYLRPTVNMRPKYRSTQYLFGRGSPHALPADLHLVDWLEKKAFEYDVITDHDLHTEGEGLLAPYSVILTGSHPEYWSEQMLSALDSYLNKGGRLMYLGGNGFYWVTSVDPERPHVIEIRRWGGTQAWAAPPGQYYHSTTGELGGLWRNRNRAPQKMLGIGFVSQGTDRNRPYQREPGSFDPRAAFIFEGIGRDEVLGDFDNLVLEWGACGFETDRVDQSLGTPAHTLLLARATGFSDVYQHVVEEVNAEDSKQGGTVNPRVTGDMAFFEYPNGGAVFSVGSISYCGCLSYNGYENNISRITENVLTRFASDEPLPERSKTARPEGC